MRTVANVSSSPASHEYRLLAGEPLGEGLRRITLERLDEAIERIDHVAAGPDRAVHEARKSIKRVRSALRLARGGIGAEAFQRENALFRAAGKLLGPARDAEVLYETLTAERDGLASRIDAGTLDTWKEQLLRGRAAEIVGLLDFQSDEVTALLETGRAGVWGWPVGEIGEDTVVKGLQRSYKKGRKRFRQLREQPSSADAAHALRRRAKDLRYQLEIIADRDPALYDELHSPAEDLTDVLGDHHNLAVLRDDARSRLKLLGKSGIASVQNVLDQRMAELAGRADQLGGQVYAERKIKPAVSDAAG